MAQTYEEMDAIAMLKADHRVVEELFEKFENARGKGKQQALAEQICMELKVHTIIEEEVFYPACRGKIEDDLLDEAYVEHDGAKVLINEIEAGGPDEQFYEAKVKVLSEMIEHHVEEEEKRSEGMFSQARAAGLDMDLLADQMRARKFEAMAQFESGELSRAEPRTFQGGEGEEVASDSDFGEPGSRKGADVRDAR